MFLVGTVYKITNKETDFVYFGETIRDVRKRWNEHLSKKVKSAGWFFTTALEEYPSSSWKFEVLETHKAQLSENADEKIESKNQLKKLLQQKEYEYILNCDQKKCYNTQLQNAHKCKKCSFMSGTDLGLAIHNFENHKGKKWTECEKCIIEGPWCEECWEKFKLLFFQYICFKCEKPTHFFFRQGLLQHEEKYHSFKLGDKQIENYSKLVQNICKDLPKWKKTREYYSEIWKECALYASCKIKPRIIDGILYV